jgi:hypothetical protein
LKYSSAPFQGAVIGFQFAVFRFRFGCTTPGTLVYD